MKNEANPRPMTPGIGVVKSIILEDYGHVLFYVRFICNGVEMDGQSIKYRGTKGKYHEGDTVNIMYYFADRTNRPRVVINDSELEACSGSLKGFALSLFCVAGLLAIVGVVYFMQNVIM